MAATYRAIAAGGGTSGTGNRTLTVTTGLVNDLLVVFVSLSDNTTTTPTMTDDHADGLGAYTRVGTALWNISGNNSAVFVRNALLGSTDTSFIITCTSGSNTAGQIGAVMVAGMTRTGASAIRTSGSLADQASGTTPKPILAIESLTTNMTIAAVMSADTTTTEPTGWTERTETGQTSPVTRLEVATRDSGFVGQTISFGAACDSEYAAWAVELDGSADSHSATSAVTVGAATASGTATFPFSATSAVTVGAATASGTATFPFSATSAVTAGAATASGSATFDAPVFSATSAVTTGVATASGTATFPFSATAAVTTGPATASGTATFTAAAGTFTGTGDATAGAATASGTATFLAAAAATEASSGSIVWGPVPPRRRRSPSPVLATLAATCSAATASGSATFTAPPPRAKSLHGFDPANFVLLGLLGLPQLADRPDLATVFFDH